MASLQLVEGLIGTICAIACFYYARQGMLAAETQTSLHAAPLEYARRNPFAAVFGALALGFLISSWSMYALPRPAGIAPRTIEKWHTITKTIPGPDPAQAAKIAALQTTLNTDTATIAAQTAEIDRLKGFLAKSPRRSRRSSTTIGANPGDAKANPEGTTAVLNRAYNPASTAGGTAAPAGPPPSAAPQSTTAAPVNPVQSAPARTPNGASQTPAGTPPH